MRRPACSIAVRGVRKVANECDAGPVRKGCLHRRDRYGPGDDAHLVGMRNGVELLQLRGLGDRMRNEMPLGMVSVVDAKKGLVMCTWANASK